MAHATLLSRRAALAISAAALAGTAVPVAARAMPKGDAVLIDAWSHYQNAIAQNALLRAKMNAASKEMQALLPPHMEAERFHSLSDAEQEAYGEVRMQEWEDAWNKSGLTALQKEQDDFWTTVLDPLAETIRNTAPTTVEGAAIKARYIMEYERPAIFEEENPKDLDLDEFSLRLFVEQLAGLGKAGA